LIAMPPMPTLASLRRYAIGRSLFAPTTLQRAIARLGFVQADPIRAPARAQDLTLRHRVIDYRAGDLEARYSRLRIEEDAFVNYGFLPRDLAQLMHPRVARHAWTRTHAKRADAILEFVRSHRSVHPRDVQRAFDHGSVRNPWGGTSNAVTRLLELMHYRGLLRVVRREQGQRVYAAALAATTDTLTPAARADALVDLLLRKYAPLPSRGLGMLCAALRRYGAPHLHSDVSAAMKRFQSSLPSAVVDGVTWSSRWRVEPTVKFLAPFDPVVWDRYRFELLWGWAYRFEAYTPAAKRVRGYYALPLLWHDQVIGWVNVTGPAGQVECVPGYVSGRPPRDPHFADALDTEINALRTFLQPRSA
jgi:uncharacterized protein